ncbi:putative methyltransferase bldM [alpha proteobacterium U9-1i]|nr:putative methyltransferase bldM [alpha proteobacterium U9-1i]
MSDDAGAGNKEFGWSKFDPESYVQHYYADPHPDDDEVVRRTCAALIEGAAGRTDLDVLDVGTGPNLFPLLSALPVARRVTAWEYAESNIAWLHQEAKRAALRAPWLHFWEIARAAHGMADASPEAPMAALRAKLDAVQGSIFDLPAANWDAATMFFCAESITARQDEFENACACFARAVRPGGMLAAAFLAGSRGYTVGSEEYPAVSVGPDELEAAFSKLATGMTVERIGDREEEIRSGYSGMLFLTARAR